MKAVDQHIKSLLFNHDCVIIPGFGGLITQYLPARIHPIRHSFSPPAKRVAFNEKLQLNDGLLISWVARHEQLSPAASAQAVAEFVAQIRQALQEQHRFQLDEIGLFRQLPGQPLDFEYFDRLNLLAESFGLPEFTVKPVQFQQTLKELRSSLQERALVPVEEVPVRKISGWRKAMRYAAIIPLVALSASAIYLASESELSLSSLDPFTLFSSQSHRSVEAGQLKMEAAQAVIAPAEPKASESWSQVPEENITAPADEAAPDSDLPEDGHTEGPALELATQPEAATPIQAENPGSQASSNASIALQPTAAKMASSPTLSTETSVKAQPAAKAESPILKETTGRYYIIAGGFAEPKNARQLQAEMSAAGLEAKIIPPGRGSRSTACLWLNTAPKQKPTVK